MRKIPKGSEVCNIMVGELEDLHTPILGLIRLKEARLLEGISEVKLPTRSVIDTVNLCLKCALININEYNKPFSFILSVRISAVISWPEVSK
jgi:hypothetical protein